MDKALDLRDAFTLACEREDAAARRVAFWSETIVRYGMVDPYVEQFREYVSAFNAAVAERKAAYETFRAYRDAEVAIEKAKEVAR